MKIIVAGGTYIEKCLYPYWNELYGSGGRAVSALAQLVDNIDFYTYLAPNEQIALNLNSLFTSDNITLKINDTNETIYFEYFHPLSIPKIYPDNFNVIQNKSINVSGDLVLRFGFMEGDAIVNGKKVVYDPQSSTKPKDFYQNGSSADELIIIANLREVKLLSGGNSLEEIQKLLINGNTVAVVVKLGPKGGAILTKDEIRFFQAYKSNKIFSIGTGDVFAAIFTYYWGCENMSIYTSAEYASKAVSLYCENQLLPFEKRFLENKMFHPVSRHISETLSIYIAGPFFNLQQRWLIEEARDNLIGRGFKIFSPFHDVGYGSANEVVAKDIKGIEDSQVIFAILDGLDSGTIFEIGYAKSLGKKVVIYVENESEEDLKMMEGTSCIIEHDFTSAIYKTIWLALEA